MRRLAWLSIAAFGVVTGCGDDGSSTGEAETEDGTTEATASGTTLPTTATSATETGTSDTTSTTDEPTTEPTTEAESSSSGTGFDPPIEECGNGFVEGVEQCDDANDDNDDACNNECRVRCGLLWSSVALPPTGESVFSPRGIEVDGDDNVVVAGFLREVTTDQRGNPTAEPDEISVFKVGPKGREDWAALVDEGDNDVSVQALALDAAGDIYLSATVRVESGRDIYAYKLSGTDGSIEWAHTYDSGVDDSLDDATGMSVGPDGNPVVVGQTRAAEGDDDIFVRKLDAATGNEVWTSTWSGVGNGVFSTDNGGPAAIGDDGTVYVFGQEYVDFSVLHGVVVAFPADGGDAVWEFTPMSGSEADNFDPIDLTIDDAAELTLAFRRIDGATNEFFMLKMATDTPAELWSRNVTDLQTDAGDGWSVTGVQAVPGGVLAAAGSLTATNGDAVWQETWVAQLDTDGQTLCQVVQSGPSQGILPASLTGMGVGANSVGGPVVAAEQVEGSDEAIWVGGFSID